MTRPFLGAEGVGSWDDFNEHPEWIQSGASWEARVAGGSKWPLGLWRLTGAFPRNKGTGGMKRGVRERERNQLAMTQALLGLHWTRNLGEDSFV